MRECAPKLDFVVSIPDSIAKTVGRVYYVSRATIMIAEFIRRSLMVIYTDRAMSTLRDFLAASAAVAEAEDYTSKDFEKRISKLREALRQMEKL